MSIEDLGILITKELNNNKKLHTFDTMFRKYNGNDLNDHIKNMINKYNSDIDNKKECTTYTKKLLFTSDRIDIYLVMWSPLTSCETHDHPEEGCLLKPLDEGLLEYEYFFCDKSLVLKQINRLVTYDIGYRQGKNDLHMIYNSNNALAFSVHIYAPPGYKPIYYKDSFKPFPHKKK